MHSPKSPLQHIARVCGFGNLNTMRRAFVRNLGVAPIDYRKSFGSAYAEISAARAAPRRPHEAEAQKSRDRLTKKRQGRRGNDQRFAGIWR
jgi:AraC-like DNA-binding protein